MNILIRPVKPPCIRVYTALCWCPLKNRFSQLPWVRYMISFSEGSDTAILLHNMSWIATVFIGSNLLLLFSSFLQMIHVFRAQIFVCHLLVQLQCAIPEHLYENRSMQSLPSLMPAWRMAVKYLWLGIWGIRQTSWVWWLWTRNLQMQG